MPSSPIAKEITLPDNWVQLQKTMIPDSETSCYWSVWYDVEVKDDVTGEVTNGTYGTAWLMWCPFGEDPSVNDSWGHVEDLDGDVMNVLTAIESVYGVDFKDSIWVELPHSRDENGVVHTRKNDEGKTIIPPGSGSVAIGKGETWDGE